jgi:branched-chain amino acid transport system permease protein
MLIDLIFGGLAAGSLYGLVGLAIMVVLRSTDIPNFAQGEMAMVSTFFAYSLLNDFGVPWYVAIAACMAFSAALGVGIQQTVIRPLIGGSELSAVIATLGVNIVLHSLAGLIWGHETHVFPSPFSTMPPFKLGTTIVSVDSIVNVGAITLVAVLFFAILKLTWAGLALRAASQNQTVARLMGISIDRSFALAWGMGGIAGGVAGVLVAPAVFLDTNLMGTLIIKSFAGCVLGGLGSIGGALVGCLLLGAVENLVGAYGSPGFADAITFLIIIGVLAVAPEGIFGRVMKRKV